MNKIILLDLNSTYAENAMQVHIMRKGIYNVNSEFYRRIINKKSPFPPWLPLVTIPLVLIISTSINNFRRQQTQPTIIVPPTTRNQEGLDLCQLCKITNSCDTIPSFAFVSQFLDILHNMRIITTVQKY